MKVEEIAAKAAELSQNDRAVLASELLRGLDTPVRTISDEEVAARIEEARRDPSVLITHEELVAGLDYRGS